MARVAVVFTGGTISTAFDPAAGGNVPMLDGAAILARTPGLDEIADVVVDRPGPDAREPLHVPDPARDRAMCSEPRWPIRRSTGRSWSRGPTRSRRRVSAGTSSSKGAKPVVVTGAMRASDAAGFDGPANLRDAVSVAASERMQEAGVVVCLAGTIEPADDVVKMHASALDTFESPNGGSLGRVGADGVTAFRRRAGRRHVATSRAAERIHLITATVAMDGALLDAAVAAGADGIVVAATGAGNTDPALLAAAVRAMDVGIPVALASRCPSGRAGAAYAFPGGGGDLGPGRSAPGRPPVRREGPGGAGARPRRRTGPEWPGGAARRSGGLTPCRSTP